jgi:ribosomal protein L12E/L44/L45/RPP1/RPP2
VLIITRSPKRADNIWKLAVHFFRETFNEDQLLDFIEVLTVEQASSKLRKVLAIAETRDRPAEMPWVAELRASAAAAAKARAEAERKAREAAAGHAAAQEKRRLEVEELRRQTRL